MCTDREMRDIWLNHFVSTEGAGGLLKAGIRCRGFDSVVVSGIVVKPAAFR